MYTAHAVRNFSNTKKKLPRTLRAELDHQVDFVCEDPSIGTQKAGDLCRVWVHKFNVLGQRYVLAYSIDEEALLVTFFAVGGHESFYRDLKNYLKA
jgi:mRNA-degrading endonuclease RelE of RelBE toxin-antitoxin system